MHHNVNFVMLIQTLQTPKEKKQKNRPTLLLWYKCATSHFPLNLDVVNTSHFQINHLSQTTSHITHAKTTKKNTRTIHHTTNSLVHCFNNTHITHAHHEFRTRIDKIPPKNLCSIYLESCLGIHLYISSNMHYFSISMSPVISSLFTDLREIKTCWWKIQLDF